MSEAADSACAEEHLNGFSSLALLAGLDRHTRILYLLTWPAAILAVARPDADAARSSTLPVEGWTRLPLADGSIDAIVVDLDAVPDDPGLRRPVATELERVLSHEGRCLAAVTHRRRPRDPLAWSQYRLSPPAARWRAALNGTTLTQLGVARLTFDGRRITDLRLPSQPDRSSPEQAADAVVLVLSGPAARDRSIVDELSATLTRQLGAAIALGRIQVRKIGKNAAFAIAGDSGIVVRLPRSAIALARARRNYAALESVHQSVAGIQKQAVPRPLGQGVAGDQWYFAEASVPGAPREGSATEISWEPQALEFITNLHAATARPVVLTASWFQQVVEPALTAVQTCAAGDDDGRTIEWLRGTLRTQLAGRPAVVVRSHGDFTGSNALYDVNGRLSGVVDWELSSGDALPLLDLLQCVDLPTEYSADGRWLRAELVFDAIERRGPLADAPEIRSYMTTLGLSEDLLVPLLLMHWVDHAGARVAARKSDDRWFQRRITAPLGRLRRLALAGGAT